MMKKQVDGEFTGWDGHTVVKLTDGSVWEQAGYYYEYHYAYRPEVLFVDGDRMLVDGMRKSVQVRQLV